MSSISKASEGQNLQTSTEATLMSELSIGENQFAYCRDSGSIDAVAYRVLCWLRAFKPKSRVGLYMSDVSAAFTADTKTSAICTFFV